MDDDGCFRLRKIVPYMKSFWEIACRLTAYHIRKGKEAASGGGCERLTKLLCSRLQRAVREERHNSLSRPGCVQWTP